MPAPTTCTDDKLGHRLRFRVHHGAFSVGMVLPDIDQCIGGRVVVAAGFFTDLVSEQPGQYRPHPGVVAQFLQLARAMR